MGKRLSFPRVKVTPATGLAFAALMIALASPGYAVGEQVAKAIGTAGLKDGAVTTPKLHDNAVISRKIRNGSVQVADLSAGARAPRSVGNDFGGAVDIPAGGWVDVLSMQLPAGSWNLFAKGIISTYNSTVTCDLVVGDTTVDRTSAFSGVSGSEFGFGDSPMSLMSMRTSSGTMRWVTLRCLANQNTPVVKDTKMIAIATRG